MLAHTPGPWAFERVCGEVYFDDGDVAPLIATVNLDNAGADQFDADGVLIASAPELLAALRAFSKAFQPSLHRSGEQTAAITGARDLLSRLGA